MAHVSPRDGRSRAGWLVSRAHRAVEATRSRSCAYELAKALTAPTRHGLVRLEVENPERLPPTGPAILAANHLSFVDSILLMFALPRPVSMLGKAEYTTRRGTRWLFCGAGMIPIQRRRAADLPGTFAQVRDVLDAGGVIGIFPEGTRSRDGRLHRGHSGAAHLALTTGAPLVPAGIVGTHAVLPTGARLVRPFRKATVRLGEPIVPGSMGLTRSSHRNRRLLTDRLMAEIRRLSEQDYVDEFAPLPCDPEDPRVPSLVPVGEPELAPA